MYFFLSNSISEFSSRKLPNSLFSKSSYLPCSFTIIINFSFSISNTSLFFKTKSTFISRSAVFRHFYLNISFYSYKYIISPFNNSLILIVCSSSSYYIVFLGLWLLLQLDLIFFMYNFYS